MEHRVTANDISINQEINRNIEEAKNLYNKYGCAIENIHNNVFTGDIVIVFLDSNNNEYKVSIQQGSIHYVLTQIEEDLNKLALLGMILKS